ncbi:MAG TPA: hypothetical protein VI451_13725 [Anaerolineales bacterium]|nr:hypothetical protein [Anaerolineales bacterium]
MLKNLRFSIRSVPIAIFLLCSLTFGPLITQLGFYWDDWAVTLVRRLNGDYWEFYAYNRPASAWTQAFFAPFLGISPLNWHLFAELIWVLTAIACWWMLHQLWPGRKRETLAMALLFAVHPIFLLHPISVAFSQQYLTFLPFLISFGTMLAALRKPERFWIWTVMGIVTALIHSLTMEYFWGLELARPFLIWIVLSEKDQERQAKVLQMLKTWLPYLAVLCAVVIWRMFFVTLLEDDPNELVLLNTLISEPISGVLRLAQTLVNDFVYITIIRWTETVKLEWFNFQDRFSLFAWGMAVIVGTGVIVFFNRFGEESTPHGQRQVIGLGFFALLVGELAVWLPGRSVTVGLYADRFSLPALLGVVILTVGLIGAVVRPRLQHVLLAILLGLSVSNHLRVQNDYRWDWVNQRRAYWQMYWRAPGLADHTAMLSDGSLFRYTGGYLTGAALNVLYTPYPGEPEDVSYWFFELDQGYFNYLPEMIAGHYPLKDDMRQYSFSGTSQEGVLVYYAPNQGNCLWVIRETDQYNPDLPALIKEAIPLSNLNQIMLESSHVPNADVFGKEPAHTWCYFYEKAELARQQDDWAGIVSLAEESAAQGFSPNNRIEWLPFVEAFAYTGDWERAIDLSVDALNYSKSTRNLFCPIWRGFEREGLDAPAGTFAEVYGRLECEGGVDN